MQGDRERGLCSGSAGCWESRTRMPGGCTTWRQASDVDQFLRMFVQDVFFLQDGRAVLTGSVEGGERVIIKPGPCDVFVDGRRISTVRIEPEMIPARADPLERHCTRAVSTFDPTGLSKELVTTQ